MVNTIAWQSRSAPKPNESIPSQSKSKADGPLQRLHNPWEGREDSRQLSETVSEFTKRLPPLASTHVGPWIWIANPHLKDRLEPELRNATFIQLASRELKQYLIKKENLTSIHPEMDQGTVARTLKPHRDQLKDDILKLAKEHGTVCGKVSSLTSEFLFPNTKQWMLFPKVDDVPRYWYKVAEATADDRLGIGAKISTGFDDDRKERLICVYTKDFSNMDDVRRVLQALVDMDLVPENGRGIYYKCDAYTCLEINSGNEYGLAASLYSSKDMLRAPTSDKGRVRQSAKEKRKQMTLGGFRQSKSASGGSKE